MRRVRATIVVVEKQCVTYSECVSVALGTQHAMRMPRCTIFFTLSQKTAQDSKNKKKVTEHKMCVLIFCTTFV